LTAVGRPSYKPVLRYKSFHYQAASWTRARRVVAKVEFHFGELFPRVGFIVTNFQTSSRAVVRFCNKRGTAEQWIKEGKQAVAMTRLSCHRFRANEVRLWLSVIAYNLVNLWRRLALPAAVANWSLTGLKQRLVKTGGRLIKHARYYWLLLAESHLTRRLFGGVLQRIVTLPVSAGLAARRAQQILMTKFRWGDGEMSAESVGPKRHFWGVAWPREANPTRSGAAVGTMGAKLPKSLPREAGWSTSGVQIGKAKWKFRSRRSICERKIDPAKPRDKRRSKIASSPQPRCFL
jgi:hypothetical protein